MQRNSSPINVPLVNSTGEVIGYSEKMLVHRRGLLHLAFSLMVSRHRNERTEYLLQRRALHKYHSGGLWANTCCSHPLMNESIADAAQRRVNDEIGIVAALDIRNVKQITYNYRLGNGLFEHEYNHLLVAAVDDITYSINPEEVIDVKWWSSDDIIQKLQAQPEIFTAWFPDVFKHIHTACLND